VRVVDAHQVELDAIANEVAPDERACLDVAPARRMRVPVNNVAPAVGQEVEWDGHVLPRLGDALGNRVDPRDQFAHEQVGRYRFEAGRRFARDCRGLVSHLQSRREKVLSWILQLFAPRPTWPFYNGCNHETCQELIGRDGLATSVSYGLAVEYLTGHPIAVDEAVKDSAPSWVPVSLTSDLRALHERNCL
jgi:hypothetical protein